MDRGTRQSTRFGRWACTYSTYVLHIPTHAPSNSARPELLEVEPSSSPRCGRGSSHACVRRLPGRSARQRIIPPTTQISFFSLLQCYRFLGSAGLQTLFDKRVQDSRKTRLYTCTCKKTSAGLARHMARAQSLLPGGGKREALEASVIDPWPDSLFNTPKRQRS